MRHNSRGGKFGAIFAAGSGIGPKMAAPHSQPRRYSTPLVLGTSVPVIATAWRNARPKALKMASAM